MLFFFKFKIILVIFKNLNSQNLNKTRETIDAALANDFNTPEVINSIVNLIKIGNKMLQQTSVNEIIY